MLWRVVLLGGAIAAVVVFAVGAWEYTRTGTGTYCDEAYNTSTWRRYGACSINAQRAVTIHSHRDTGRLLAVAGAGVLVVTLASLPLLARIGRQNP